MPSRDYVMIQFGYDNWTNHPDSIKVNGLGRAFNAYLCYDFPIMKSNFSFAAGLGIGTSSIFLKDQQIVLTDTAASISFISEIEPYKKYKLTTSYIEAPFEIRYFGNKENITPYLDSLVPNSLFFSNFYASGTRTVRGLEALSLAIPPTPGQSIVRRPKNEDLFSLGSVFKKSGYDVRYIYGGNSFFDNMGYFFGHNGYQVLDKGDIPKQLVHHTTAWGIDDEATFQYTLDQCDKSYREGRLFFNHMMTVSNHRPYTFPDGRIDIPSSAQSSAGGVKYTDYAIHSFLKEAAKKPWFDQTVFVIVSDHCSRSAGKTDLPVNRYHIPCIIYAPKIIKPTIEKRLISQIDLAPTLLGLLNIPYTSQFFGFDIYKTPINRDRVFISTYQNLGYIRDGQLVILSPQKKVATYQPNFETGVAAEIPASDSLINEAIAWYQGASYSFRNRRIRKNNEGW